MISAWSPNITSPAPEVALQPLAGDVHFDGISIVGSYRVHRCINSGLASLTDFLRHAADQGLGIDVRTS